MTFTIPLLVLTAAFLGLMFYLPIAETKPAPVENRVAGKDRRAGTDRRKAARHYA